MATHGSLACLVFAALPCLHCAWAARDEAAPAAVLRTRHAAFVPASFAELPGWRADHLDDALQALRRSCAALRRKAAWEAPCRRAERSGADAAAAHDFFEQEFALYQVRYPDGTAHGAITGYYEAELRASRHRAAPYLYPVYAVPDDLLLLDARAVAGAAPGTLRVRIDGRKVVPLPPGAPPDAPGYRLELAGAQADVRTRRYRLRLDGDRVVPYFSRREIEQGLMTRARVIAWVDDPAALYSMQIQGAGKLRLPDGSVLRVAFGEQNGHPFLPSLQSLPHLATAQGRRRVLATRGLDALAAADAGDAAEPDAGDEPVVRGAGGERAAPASAPVPDLDQVIAALMPRAQPAPAAPPAQPAPPAVTLAAPRALPNNDPSYVFFRAIPDSDSGPPGALGVPLTAGRSIAVDPRTTPLGAPVFIATRAPGDGAPLNRLMVAQDTGGAIRGAVRADYFWGLGAPAFARASQMNADGRMWLLLPKNLQLQARAGGVLLRGAGGEEAECLVPDPDLCVE